MLKQRVFTALIAVVVLLGVLYVAPPPVARIVIAGLFAAAAWEWGGFLGVGSTAVRPVFVAAVVGLQALLWQVLPNQEAYLGLLAVAFLWWSSALVWLFFFPTPIPATVVWLGGLLVLLPAYAALDWLYQESSNALLALLIVVWLADIGAYFAGRACGRVKLAPRISPGKTWEGVIGGLIAVVFVVAAAGGFLGLSLAAVLPFCAAVALLSIVGDLTVSMFKRHSGVKDSGSLFPGHGGVLDRIDSVCAAAPLFAAGFAVLGVSL